MIKKIKYIFICFNILCCLSYSFARDKSVDSLLVILKNAPNDSVRIAVLGVILENSPDGEWESYNEKIKIIAEKNTIHCKSNTPECVYFKTKLAAAISNIGYIYVNTGEPLLALQNFLKSLEIQKSIGDKQGQAWTMTNISFIHKSQGNIAKSLEWELASLKIKEELGDINGIAYSLNNIAVVYKKQGLKNKALEYYKKSLANFEKSNSNEGIGLLLNNIGMFYKDLNDEKNAMLYLKKSLVIRQAIKDKTGEANTLNNIGGMYSLSNLDTSIIYYKLAIKIYEESGDKDGLSYALYGISSVYLKKGLNKEAQKFAQRSLDISKELGYPENICQSANVLYETYEKQNNYEKALENYDLYILMKDSINNQETRKASLRAQLKYDYEKKAASNSVKVIAEKKIIAAKIEQEQNQRYFLYGGLCLTLFFGAFMFNRFRVISNQKNIIENQKRNVEQQKHIIQEKQEEVLSSIRYAKRIQQSLLPTERYVDRIFKTKI